MFTENKSIVFDVWYSKWSKKTDEVMFSMSTQPDEESVLNTRETDFLSDAATMFVLSMVMASVLVAPAVIATAQASEVWRLLKKW